MDSTSKWLSLRDTDYYMAHVFFVSMDGLVVAKRDILNPIASHTIGQQFDKEAVHEVEYYIIT